MDGGARAGAPPAALSPSFSPSRSRSLLAAATSSSSSSWLAGGRAGAHARVQGPSQCAPSKRAHPHSLCRTRLTTASGAPAHKLAAPGLRTAFLGAVCSVRALAAGPRAAAWRPRGRTCARAPPGAPLPR
eukprot:scaffold1034_cov418-Prasinococcus_capsulatus_cf.AAC.6